VKLKIRGSKVKNSKLPIIRKI